MNMIIGIKSLLIFSVCGELSSAAANPPESLGILPSGWSAERRGRGGAPCKRCLLRKLSKALQRLFNLSAAPFVVTANPEALMLGPLGLAL